MADVLALGAVSSLITILNKGIKLVEEKTNRTDGDVIATDVQVSQIVTDLQHYCDEAKAFLQDEQDPLVDRIIDVAEKLWRMLTDLQAEPGRGGIAIDALNLRQIDNDFSHYQTPETLNITHSHSQEIDRGRPYGTTYLTDNARAHLGDVNNYYLSYHYYQSKKPFQSAIEALRQEVKDCTQILPSRLMVLMANKSTSESVTNDPAKIRRATLKELANTMKHALWYPELHSREERIVKAHNKTFQWIFDDPQQGGEQPWHSFIRWLEGGDGIYWINGKAGSGKSTLINYVKDEERTIQALEDWAKLTNLIAGSFFFWNSGTPLEKSLKGLYRSLIIQVLEKAPDTVKIMFTEPEIDHVKNLVIPVGGDAYWSEQRLADALSKLASCPSKFETYCFFIDGLDEFDGDHDLLVEVLEDLTAAKHIKVCCSSRPLPIFAESFADCPSLKLQDLTTRDIRLYVEDELRSSRKGRKFAESKSDDFKLLVSRVVKKSAGVFLWVYLVVRSLQSGVRNGDTINELQARIDDSPEDLLNLFHRMVVNLEPRYKMQGAIIFRTLFAAPNNEKLRDNHTPGISLLDLYLATEDAILTKALVRFPGRTNWKSVVER